MEDDLGDGPVFKSISLRDVFYIVAIMASAAVTAYRVGELEKGLQEIKTGYVTIEANNLQNQALELEITNARLSQDKAMLDLELRILKSRTSR